jgi:hypothetical protein
MFLINICKACNDDSTQVLSLPILFKLRLTIDDKFSLNYIALAFYSCMCAAAAFRIYCG